MKTKFFLKAIVLICLSISTTAFALTESHASRLKQMLSEQQCNNLLEDKENSTALTKFLLSKHYLLQKFGLAGEKAYRLEKTWAQQIVPHNSKSYFRGMRVSPKTLLAIIELGLLSENSSFRELYATKKAGVAATYALFPTEPIGSIVPQENFFSVIFEIDSSNVIPRLENPDYGSSRTDIPISKINKIWIYEKESNSFIDPLPRSKDLTKIVEAVRQYRDVTCTSTMGCRGHSRLLQGLLKAEGIDTQRTTATAHTFLIIPAYFPDGSDLIIDPTWTQFIERELLKFIPAAVFVGSMHSLETTVEQLKQLKKQLNLRDRGSKENVSDLLSYYKNYVPDWLLMGPTDLRSMIQEITNKSNPESLGAQQLYEALVNKNGNEVRLAHVSFAGHAFLVDYWQEIPVIIDPTYLQFIKNSEEISAPPIFIGRRKELIEFFEKHRSRIIPHDQSSPVPVDPAQFVDETWPISIDGKSQYVVQRNF